MQELPDIIGVSRRTLFAGRADESTVTAKTWHKLEEAEASAGLYANEESSPPAMVAENQDTEIPPECPAGISKLEQMMGELLARMDRLEKKIDGIQR